MEIIVGIVCLMAGAGGAVLAMRNAKAGSIREAESKIQSAHARRRTSWAKRVVQPKP